MKSALGHYYINARVRVRGGFEWDLVSSGLRGVLVVRPLLERV